MSTHIVSMLSMCCRSDAVPSSPPSAVTPETVRTFGPPEVSDVSKVFKFSKVVEVVEVPRFLKAFNACAPASGWSCLSCASA